jgi:hypothetical protein
MVAELSPVEDEEREGGSCPSCLAVARRYQCWQCCEAMWLITCAHRQSPPPIRAGRRDGSEPHRMFCSDCSAPVTIGG